MPRNYTVPPALGFRHFTKASLPTSNRPLPPAARALTKPQSEVAASCTNSTTPWLDSFLPINGESNTNVHFVAAFSLVFWSFICIALFPHKVAPKLTQETTAESLVKRCCFFVSVSKVLGCSFNTVQKNRREPFLSCPIKFRDRGHFGLHIQLLQQRP